MEGIVVKVVLNPDKETVAAVRAGLKRTGGYCPCRLTQNEDTKSMCTEFREQQADPAFEGFCHCLLYFKALTDDRKEADARALAAAKALGFEEKASE